MGHHIRIRGVQRLLTASYRKPGWVPPEQPVVTRTTQGDWFLADLRSWVDWSAWVYGEYEPALGRILEAVVDPGDDCIDVGANSGLHTLRLSRLAPDGTTHAFEPVPDLANRVRLNCEINGRSNVVVHEVALGAKPGVASLNLPEPSTRNRGTASLLRNEKHHGAATLRIPVSTLDSVELNSPRLVKIDVEGFEPDVLEGGTLMLESARPVVVFEENADYRRTGDKSARRILHELGYRFAEVRPVGAYGAGRFRLTKPAPVPVGNPLLLAVHASDRRTPLDLP
nr:FkbM family methyltransferase [Rhabdothermincola salaria]